MALLKFNPNFLTLTVEAGAEERYKPSMKVKALTKKINALKDKVKAEQERQKKEYQAFLDAEVNGEIKEINAEVLKINKETYPDLEKVQKGLQASAKPRLVKPAKAAQPASK